MQIQVIILLRLTTTTKIQLALSVCCVIFTEFVDNSNKTLGVEVWSK